METLPEYERLSSRMVERRDLAAGFARQIELTTAPFLDRALSDCTAIDIGCGYGHTAAQLASKCISVVGLEPNAVLAGKAELLCRQRNLDNVVIRQEPIDQLADEESFDLAIMDNVFAHIEHQQRALWRMSRCLRPGGVAYILVPNKLWPMDACYNLPFLTYLPVRWASWYLRACGRGHSYRDASYAPTYRRLRKLLDARPELNARFSLPADITLAEGGRRLTYRLGVELLRRFPQLWMISKSFLVVAKKQLRTPPYAG
jgi:SAM-dependent methyltransferase